MMCRIALIIVSLSLSLASNAADTQLNLFRPFAVSDKHAPVMIESQIKGHCFQQSERIKRDDAWRCVAEDDKVYDPCFSKPFGSEQWVYCALSPWTGKSVQMVLDPPLMDTAMIPLDMSRTLPWAIELSSGERCVSIDSSQLYEGLKVHYQCGNNIELLGDAHRCATVWTILLHDPQGITLMDIATAWF